jgi:hypothetical protein
MIKSHNSTRNHLAVGLPCRKQNMAPPKLHMPLIFQVVLQLQPVRSYQQISGYILMSLTVNELTAYTKHPQHNNHKEEILNSINNYSIQVFNDLLI